MVRDVALAPPHHERVRTKSKAHLCSFQIFYPKSIGYSPRTDLCELIPKIINLGPFMLVMSVLKPDDLV